jgi:hypothetical protein
MQYRNIPYEYDEWQTPSGKTGKAYSCEYFDFHPYYMMSFSTDTKAEMHECIDDYLDNRATYEYNRKLSDASAATYYTDTTRYQGD